MHWSLDFFSISLQKGQGYFYKRREKYKCTVFKVNMGVKGIHVCDKKGIRVLFNMEKVSIIYLFITGLLIGKYNYVAIFMFVAKVNSMGYRSW